MSEKEQDGKPGTAVAETGKTIEMTKSGLIIRSLDDAYRFARYVAA